MARKLVLFRDFRHDFLLHPRPDHIFIRWWFVAAAVSSRRGSFSEAITLLKVDFASPVAALIWERLFPATRIVRTVSLSKISFGRPTGRFFPDFEFLFVPTLPDS